jgi:LAO/AO transport system kinase
VVSAPGLGDEVQAIKAGILEIADIHVVSKCDRSDANRTLTDIKAMLTLGTMTAAKPEWTIPVVGVSSFTGEGFEGLVNAISDHRKVAFETETGRRRQLGNANFRLLKTAETLLMQRFGASSAELSPLLADRLRRRDGDPYSLAEELVTSSLQKES